MVKARGLGMTSSLTNNIDLLFESSVTTKDTKLHKGKAPALKTLTNRRSYNDQP